MEFQEFVKERQRMCEKNYHYCIGCPLYNICGSLRISWVFDYPQEAEQIVSDWSKEHPIVTNGNKFCEIMSETFGKDIKISFEHTTDGKIIIRLNEEWWNEEYREQGGNQND